MIIQKCDICNKEVNIVDTIVLYSKPLDYCRECRGKAEKARQEYKREIECQFIILESKLKSKEKKIIQKLQNKNGKRIVKNRKGENK